MAKIFKPFAVLLQVVFFRKTFADFFDVKEKMSLRQVPVFFKTVYLNYRCIKSDNRKQIPILVYSNVSLISTMGEIIVPEKVSFGMVGIGIDWGYRSKGETRFRVDGTIIFGGSARIMKGCNISVSHSATLMFGDDNLISENSMIFCTKRISFGKSLRLTYDCNVFDSDFHYTINLDTKTINPKSKAIRIGNHVWIGNKATIKKGTIIPDYTIVAASGTLLTKDYTNVVDKFGCLGGCPAKPLNVRSCRIWKNEHAQMKMLDEWFAAHPDHQSYSLEESEKVSDYTGVEDEV